MAVEIAPESLDPKRPFSNLEPIVDVLVRAGNSLLTDGFIGTPSGWYCRLAKPIDVNLVASTFILPATVELSERHDTILDRLSWSAIEGPGADTARLRGSRDIAQR